MLSQDEVQYILECKYGHGQRCETLGAEKYPQKIMILFGSDVHKNRTAQSTIFLLLDK